VITLAETLVRIPYDEVAHVWPEIILAITMCAVLLTPMLRGPSVAGPSIAGLIGLGGAAIATGATMGHANEVLFHGMLVVDPFSQFFKLILIVMTALAIGQRISTNRTEMRPTSAPEYLCLMVGAVLGMCLIVSANNLLTIVIALETASIPSFALAGFRKRDTLSTEGSLKYVIFGAASTAVMVYGMSLVYGATGTLELGGIAAAAGEAVTPMLALGLLAMFTGIAFKLAAVPMHFWCPDVFQGAPTDVATFLSVASKGAAACLLLRIMQVFGATQVGPDATGFGGMAIAVGLLGAVTCTWGNLVALHQTNMKRMLAYSSIAHAGYLIMAVALLPLGATPAEQSTVAGAVLFYLMVYGFMNVGAFTVAAIVESRTGGRDTTDYANLFRQQPALAAAMTVFLLSLFGMPGLGGFLAKIQVMKGMAQFGMPGFVLIAVLLINTLLSLYFYLRPVYFMAFVEESQGQPMARPPRNWAAAILAVCVIALIWTGIDLGTTHLTAEYGSVHQPAAVIDVPDVGLAGD